MFSPGTVALRSQTGPLIFTSTLIVDEYMLILLISHALFLVVVGLLALATTNWKHELQAFYYNKIVYGNSLNRQRYLAVSNLLSRHMSYFRMLSPEGKARFILRLQHFADSREFVGMQNLVITSEMRTLISASAVQLTFGLRDYNIRFLEEVRVFPESFYHPFLKASLKGAMSTTGFLAISWKDFLLGYADDDDNYNLGLHEMAHALKLDVRKSDSFDLRFSTYIDTWLKVGIPAFNETRKTGGSFLRKYGGTNRHEFFAVCVEHFFESPEKFSRELPDVYNHLCKLLNQNPMNSSGDYKVTESFKRSINANSRLAPVPANLVKLYPKDAFHRFHLFTMATLFFSLVIDLAWGFDTVVNWMQLAVAGFAGAVVAGSFQWSYLVRHRVFNATTAFLYGIALFVFICNAYLLVNWLFPVSEKTTYHEISEIERVDGKVVLELKGGAYQSFQQIRSISGSSAGAPKRGSIAAFRFDIGCMGMPVLNRVDFGSRDGNKFIPD